MNEQKIKRITSAGGIVRNAEGRIIIVQQNNGAWSLPKGKLEFEEQPDECAVREITEETGLDPKKNRVVCLGILDAYTRWKMNKQGGDDQSERKTIIIYLFETDAADDTPLRPRDPDNPIARWVTIDQAIEMLTHPEDKAFLARMKKRLT